MRVSRPLVYEPEGGLQPQVTSAHEIVQGLPRNLPNLRGFVLTSVKDSPLVEVPIRSNKPGETENQTVLATWTYGLGRTAVFTSDAGKRWAGEWAEWPGYDQFFSQLVRWAMRPTKSDAQFTVATNVKDSKVQVVVNALDQDDEFLNFLDMQAVAVGPDLEPMPLVMRQVAPGRYTGEFDASGAGSYLVNVLPGAGMAPVTTGASVPFSDEYRIRQTNFAALEQLAKLTPDGGRAGVLSDPLETENLEELLENNAYRGGLPRAMSMQDIWHWCLLVGAFCLFGDVFVRRVAVNYAYPYERATQFFKKTESPKDEQRQASLQRLKSKKTEVSSEMESAKAATRFEANESIGAVDLEPLGGNDAAQEKPKSGSSGTPQINQENESGYTSRLLAAKRAANVKKDDDKS
jgi:hypothetical protein